MQNKLQAIYEKDASKKAVTVEKVKDRGPCNQLLIWCQIIFLILHLATEHASNSFVAILIGIGLIQIPRESSKPLKDFFKSLTDVVIKLVDLIMLMAPLGYLLLSRKQ